MVRTKDSDGIKSNLIIAEVQKRPCLFDTNHPHYGDRTEKARSWEEVCRCIVPGWSGFCLPEKFAAGKDIQKRWRSIRDSFTKAYRQGKCVLPEQCSPNSRRYHYHKQMSFLLRALQNKKPRYSIDRCDTLSEVSNSPQHMPIEEYVPKDKIEISQSPKPLDLKTRTDIEKTFDKANQAIDMKTPFDFKIDANAILPDDYFDDDKLFMNSLLPLFKKMSDDTRLMCRIEVLKIIRYALQGHNERMGMKEEKESRVLTTLKDTLSMTTRSADGSRPIRKRKMRSPSPISPAPKRRGPGRPRKIRPPVSSDEEEFTKKRLSNKMEKSLPSLEPRLSELEEKLNAVTSVAQLETPLFMKIYNLERTNKGTNATTHMQVTVKSEPLDPTDVPM